MRLFHFTDSRNIPSIMQHGLMSWQRLVTGGVSHFPASNSLSRSLDSRNGLQDYIRLCLDTRHPMAYLAEKQKRVERLIWLEIQEEALTRATVLYSDTNATANIARINGKKETALQSSNNQREILVQGIIPVSFIIFPAAYRNNSANFSNNNFNYRR